MEKISLVSWNVNGLLGIERLTQLLTQLEVLGWPDFVCLQETHSNNCDVISRWEEYLKQYKCYFNHGDGRNRGTAVLVKKSTLFYLNLNGLNQDLDGRYTILKGFLGERLVTIASIYAPVDRVERDKFFCRFLGNNLDGTLLLMGDFNAAVSRTLDRTYNRNRSDEDTELHTFMGRSDTVDVWRLLHGDKVEYSYTHPLSSSRIDLFLTSSEVGGEVINAGYIPSFSDHKILNVEINVGRKLIGNDFVKIKPHIVQDEIFNETFQGFWWEQKRMFYNTLIKKIKNGTFEGNITEAGLELANGSDLNKKIFIDNLIINAKWWDKFKKRIFLCAKISGKRISRLKNNEYDKYLQEYFREIEGSRRKNELRIKLKQIVYSINKENMFKAQVSDRINFEKCSAPFFSSIKQRQKTLYIDKLKDDNGVTLVDRKEIEGYLLRCYEELYMEKQGDRTHHNYFFDSLPKIQDDILGQEVENKIIEKEVNEAIEKGKNGKCPGIDGIPIEFYKKYSNLLVPYITKLFNYCMESGDFPFSWDNNVVKLIPKNKDLDFSFNNLRPLTMGNVDRRLYARVWYKRLVKTSCSIINERQTGGVPGRSIQGSTLLIHLLISFYCEKGLEGYLLSLDDSKAYDVLIRDFMWDTMRHFGYSNCTINSVKGLYKNTNGTICLNGFFSKFFHIKSGVLQGCPLSGLLYVISGEPLARAINRDIGIQGFRLPSQQEIKMVQHVDDKTLLLNNQGSINLALKLVNNYSKMCGSVINKSKSFVIKIGASRVFEEQNQINFQGIKVVSKNEDYGCRKMLGIFFSAVPITYIDKNFLVVTKKCQEVMDTWDDRNLSLVGRVLIVNSLVIPKLVYLLQTLNITKRRLGFLERRISRFIWKGMGCKLKLNILEWGKERGGLGLIPVDLKARALRLKTIKDYLGKGDEGRDRGPITQILAYFLDATVKANLYRDLEDMQQILQDPVTGSGGILSRQDNTDHVLRYFLEDVKVIKLFEERNYDVSLWDSVVYLGKLIEFRTIEETKVMKEGRNSDKIQFFRQLFNNGQENNIWKSAFTKALDTKIRAFNYKMINDLLPLYGKIGGNKKYCRYCKNKYDFEILETMEHLFIECVVAVRVWGEINRRYHGIGTGGIDLDRDSVIYKIGLRGEKVILVSEVNWALWKNRNNNSREQGVNLAGSIAVRGMYVARIGKLMKVDRSILSGVKFIERWGIMGEFIDAVNRL